MHCIYIKDLQQQTLPYTEKKSKGVKVNYLTRNKKKLNAVKHIFDPFFFFCNFKLKSLEICSFHVTCTKKCNPTHLSPC